MALRISTAGSVDDGKSTLIGRLLYDSKTVFEDQLASVQKASKKYGDGSTNLALLTDGLRAEREQGITIDVAYRYFATPVRSFVVADTPGHAQYTRNMVTGASVSDVAIVLVDARVGLTEQTRRHLFIVSLLGIRHVILAVNKMDLVSFDEGVFRAIAKSVHSHLSNFSNVPEVTSIPLSALNGDNVVNRGVATPWFEGPTLLEFLEQYDVERDTDVGARLAVQYVIRPYSTDFHDYRGLAGRVSGGSFERGDEVVVYPSGHRTRISSIRVGGVEVSNADAGRSVALELEDDIDVGRGDVVVSASALAPLVTDEIVCDICWMVDKPLNLGSRWILKHGSKSVKAVVTSIDGRYSIETARVEPPQPLQLNDLGIVTISTSAPLPCDEYAVHKRGGAAILIDEADGATVAALMFRRKSR